MNDYSDEDRLDDIHDMLGEIMKLMAAIRELAAPEPHPDLPPVEEDPEVDFDEMEDS